MTLEELTVAVAELSVQQRQVVDQQARMIDQYGRMLALLEGQTKINNSLMQTDKGLSSAFQQLALKLNKVPNGAPGH